MRILKRIFLFILASLFIFLTGFFIYYFAVTHSVTLDTDKLNISQNDVSIYDKDDIFCATCSANGKNGVDIQTLPPHVVNAFISAEDKRFFKHNGLDYKRMAKALLKNVTSLSFKEGASTISQQLIKNTQLTPEKTINRKLKEIKLTRQLEKRFTKREILQTYLNTIYFGHSCYGLNNAAKFYFNRSPNELTLEDAALLAGLVKSPNNYSPFKNPQNALKRRNVVLKSMEENDYINITERLSAQKVDLPTTQHSNYHFAENYCHSVAMEMDEYIGENYYGGLNVYTYLDENLQREIEKNNKESQIDVSICIIDNENMGVKALYSTVGVAKRLPASTIKPLLVYAPAIQEDVISPATPILDEKTDFNGYSPRNYDDKYHGYVSAREALAKSYNIPTVKVLNALGIDKAVSYLDKMQLKVEKDDKSLALALGGMRYGYSLREICTAYATFANEGYFASSAFIRKITDKHGNVIFERRINPSKVFTADTTTLINDMLKSVVADGTAKKLKNLPYDVAAKTGTHGTENGNTDAYCISYTSKDTIGVWMGSGENTPLQSLTGGGLSCNQNFKIHKFIYKNSPPSPFKKSNDVIEVRLDKQEYQKNHALLLCDDNAPVQEQTIKELFKKKNLPQQKSIYFSRPIIEKPKIACKAKGICLYLCQREYLSIIVNREENGNFTTVYNGKILEEIVDENVEVGKEYIYSITPYYQQNIGTTIILPKIKYVITRNKGTDEEAPNKEQPPMFVIPKEWWRSSI